MATPPITFSVQPEEKGKLVYLPVAALSANHAPTGMVAFRLWIRNLGDADVRLEKIRVSFPSHPALTRDFARDETLGPNATRVVYLDDEESIQLGAVPPRKIRIRLYFEGFDQPKQILRSLAPHRSPTPSGSYRFPGRARDMEFDEYFTQKARHSGGNQHFGYDISNRGWNEDEQAFAAHRTGTSGKKNEHWFGWNQPLYAMADGTVLRAVGDRPDNPAPGQRAVVRLDDHTAGNVSAVASANLSSTRSLVAVRTQQGMLKLIVFDHSSDGETLARKGSVEDAAVQQLSVTGLSSTRAVTAARTGDGKLAVKLWSVSDDGQTVSPLDAVEAGAIGAVKAVALSSSRVALAGRSSAGKLFVFVFDVTGDELTDLPVGSGSGGAVGAFDLTAPSPDRLVTAVRTSSGTQKVILWHVAEGGAVTRGASARRDAVTTLAAVSMKEDNRFATAVRTTKGRFELFVWEIGGDGSLKLVASKAAGKVTALSLSLFGKKTVASAVRLPSGRMKLILWKVDDDVIERLGEKSAGPVGLVSLARRRSESSTAVTAVRTQSGRLKVILFRLSGGNGYWILHGDEIVLYAHMKQGSLDPALRAPGTPVKEGQFLGRMGNSGPSSNAHLHLHVRKKETNASVDELIRQIAEGTLGTSPTAAYRPLPFHDAQALRLEDVERGISSDKPFAEVQHQGLYFERMAIWPGKTTPGIPTGRDELAFHGVPAARYQALFDAVTGAKYRPVWFDAYTAGDSLRYNVLFRPSPNPYWSARHGLTARQYDRLVEERKKKGYRPVHVNSYRQGGRIRYAAIFEKSNGVTWRAYHGRGAQEHQKLFKDLSSRGYVPVNVSVVSVNRQRSYTALYEKRDVGGFVLKSFLTPAQYQAKYDALSPEGLDVAYLDAYRHNGGVRFSAIWNRGHQGTIRARHGLTGSGYQQQYQKAKGEGYRTEVVAGYAQASQSRFAGVWCR